MLNCRVIFVMFLVNINLFATSNRQTLQSWAATILLSENTITTGCGCVVAIFALTPVAPNQCCNCVNVSFPSRWVAFVAIGDYFCCGSCTRGEGCFPKHTYQYGKAVTVVTSTPTSLSWHRFLDVLGPKINRIINWVFNECALIFTYFFAGMQVPYVK